MPAVDGGGLRIGVDLDNTLADFDDLFRRAAVESGLLPTAFAGGKAAVRAALRARPGGEEAWQRLQGQVYGPRMADAPLFPGAAGFLIACRARAVPVFIVSHKTLRGHGGGDLHAAARAWLVAKGVFEHDGFALDPGHVFLEPDRAAKLERIAALSLTHFVDDLPELLADPAFPPGPRRLLFAPAGAAAGHAAGITACRSWGDIQRAVFGE